MYRIILLVLFSFFKVTAQNPPATYQFSETIAAKIESDTLPWKYQLGATDYSISQHYQKALETWDKQPPRVRILTREDSLYFNTFKKQPAKDYLIARSANEKIIIINEAHHNNRHRVFTASLLKGLYNNGYRYLGLEALSDTLINKRKFAVHESGYYTQEPQMANLIHEAIALGFTVFGYETTDGSNGKDREIKQASNIAKMVRQHPEAKFLIHCGYDHVIEGTPADKSWEKAMAGRLKEMTNIDPFTIDQVAYSEKSELKFTSPYVTMANASSPVILVNQQGKTFNGNPASDQVDARVIHPITRYNNNRPNWLLDEVEKKQYKIPKSEISDYPVLVLAYRKNEYEENGIPADVVECTNEDDPANLVLEKGAYKIIMKNKKYKIINELEIKIK